MRLFGIVIIIITLGFSFHVQTSNKSKTAQEVLDIQLAVSTFRDAFKFKFITDEEKFNTKDVWEVPEIISGEFTGDSEDFHVLLADHLVFSGIPEKNINFILLNGTDKCILKITSKPEDIIINYYDVAQISKSSIQTDDFTSLVYTEVRYKLF